jgi:DNA-binding CsgD family transcriptional regulator
MALSRTDEIDLLTALYEGLHEDPRWATFLSRVQRRTRADHVSIICGQGDAPIHSATQWFVGSDMRAQAQQLSELAALDPTPYHRLRPGRVYSATELMHPEDPDHGRFRKDYLERIGIRAGRYMRVTEPGGRSAWLSITRGVGDFSAADSALLSALAPHLSIALRTLGELESARFHAAVSDDALTRAGIGWAALDAQAHLIDTGGDTPLRAHASRLVAAASADAGGTLARSGERTPDRAPAAPHALRLDGDTPLDLIAVPVPNRPLTASVMPTSIALTRRARAPSSEQASVLARLMGLSSSEARLAVCLASGKSLAEAADALHLTIETARNYSKRLYAKTNTRGQPELVRFVLNSVASLV